MNRHSNFACSRHFASRRPRAILHLAIAVSLPVSTTAFAQSVESTPVQAPASGGIVGLGTASVPKYTGADESRIKAVPVLEYHWANGVFVGGEHAALVGYQAATPSLQYGVALGVGEGRQDYQDGPLAGMGKISSRPVAVSFVKIPLSSHFSIDSNLRLGSGNDHAGAVLRLGGAWRAAVSRTAQLSFNAAAGVANGAYMRDYFGVSGAQTASSGYAVYAPSAGLLDISAGVRMFWQVSSSVSLLGGVSVSHLAHGAQDSPFVKSASAHKVFIGFARTLGGS